MTTKKKLCTIKGISEAKMEKIKEASNKLCVSGCQSGKERLILKYMYIILFLGLSFLHNTRKNKALCH